MFSQRVRPFRRERDDRRCRPQFAHFIGHTPCMGCLRLAKTCHRCCERRFASRRRGLRVCPFCVCGLCPMIAPSHSVRVSCLFDAPHFCLLIGKRVVCVVSSVVSGRRQSSFGGARPAVFSVMCVLRCHGLSFPRRRVPVVLNSSPPPPPWHSIASHLAPSCGMFSVVRAQAPW